MPSGSVAPEPARVLGSRDAEQHHARRAPASAASAAALRSESRVCCTTPGIERDRARLGQPLRDEQRQHQLRRLQPGLGDQPAHRRRRPQPARPVTAPRLALPHAPLHGPNLVGPTACPCPPKRWSRASGRVGGAAGVRVPGRRLDADGVRLVAETVVHAPNPPARQLTDQVVPRTGARARSPAWSGRRRRTGRCGPSAGSAPRRKGRGRLWSRARSSLASAPAKRRRRGSPSMRWPTGRGEEPAPEPRPSARAEISPGETEPG